MEAPSAAGDPLLRTLAPLLRGLERETRTWLEGPHRFPLSMMGRARLEGMANDLRRQADALDVDRPLLVVMLMGGTGVGKSTLLNALAGAPIAQASFTRPTTRDPVVYYHESQRPERFDPALRHCRLVPHDREALAQKVIVDTPDLDSNDLANREKLLALLPVADIVLYVGSQEKYHDKLGWELFKEQRKRRAFAFVLNKWDRCVQAGASGLRPDEDLLRDLRGEGFESPLLFRTMAQTWLDFRRTDNAAALRSSAAAPPDLPEGEQFAELLNWLELGLTRLEIEAVKARGVGQLLVELGKALEEVRAPDLTEEARRVQEVWARILRDEAAVFSDVLLSTLEPYQNEIEHHFSVQGQQRFRGIMAMYLRLTSRVRYVSGTLRDRIPFAGRLEQKVETPAAWNLAAFAHEATRSASERVLEKRGSALVNRLVVDASHAGFPLNLLDGPTRQASREDWHARYDRALIEALAEVERIATRPTGFRKVLQVLLVGGANVLPEIVFLGGVLMILYRYFDPGGKGYSVSLFDVFLPFVVTLIFLILLQGLIAWLLSLRWPAIRSEFQRQLIDRVEKELLAGYDSIPGDVAARLVLEREQVDKLMGSVREVVAWLEERQQAASIAGLYGHSD